MDSIIPLYTATLVPAIGGYDLEYRPATDEDIIAAYNAIVEWREREEREREASSRCKSYVYHSDGSVTVTYANGYTVTMTKSDIAKFGLG